MPAALDPHDAAARFIPRPPDAAPGRLAPWHAVSADRRTNLGVAEITAALHEAGRDLSSSIPPEPLDELSGAGASDIEGLRDSAVLVAIFEEAGEARLVLTRRADHLRSHRGQVAFPGGRIDEGELALDAAIREAHEEVGLEPTSVAPVAWLRPIVTFASGSLIRPFVATLAERPGLTIAPAEVDRAFDVSISELLADGTFHEELWRRASPRRAGDADAVFPIFFFEVADEVIWGATARILTELCCLAVGVSMS